MMESADWGEADSSLLSPAFIRLCRLMNAQNEASSRTSPASDKADGLLAELKSIAEEMSARYLNAEVNGLLSHADDAIRSCAGHLFTTTYPDECVAALTGVAKNLPTQDVLARLTKIQDGWSGLEFEDCLSEQLIERFVETVTRENDALFLDYGGGKDSNAMKKLAYDCQSERESIFVELNCRGKLKLLLSLFDHPLHMVRLLAATSLLAVYPHRAVPVFLWLKENSDVLKRAPWVEATFAPYERLITIVANETIKQLNAAKAQGKQRIKVMLPHDCSDRFDEENTESLPLIRTQIQP